MKDFDKMVQARLFDNTAPWPMARRELEDFNNTIETMGLVEAVPGQGDTRRRTPLGEADYYAALRPVVRRAYTRATKEGVIRWRMQ